MTVDADAAGRLDADWMAAPATRAVMEALAAVGGEARFVGGCVRNALLGRPITDIDIATTLTPEAVLSAAEAAGLKAVPTGMRHGTVTVVAAHRPFEVTTLRIDVETDGRHAVVAFTDDWRADAARRDFTMNTLSVTADGRVFDYFGGAADAKAGRVRFVGDPVARIREDYLRILRFFRFFAQLGRPPADPPALAAIRAEASGIDGLSGERLRQELLKLLAVSDPLAATRLMADTGVLQRIVPEFDVERLAAMVPLEAASGLPPEPVRRLAALAVSGTEALADRLRLSNAEAERLAAAAETTPPVPTDIAARSLQAFAYRAGVTAAVDRLLLDRAAAGHDADAGFPAALRHLAAWTPPVFPLSGKDLLTQGMHPGPAVGSALKRLEDWWIDQAFRPDRSALLQRLHQAGS